LIVSDQIPYRAGFPRVFDLRYHGYARFFRWALGRYRSMEIRNNSRPLDGM
jgi:hypothetical protein